jgi:AAA domain/Virulence protein RhuM family
MRTHQKPSASNTSDEPQKGGIVIYQDKQKKATLEVRLEEETVWLSQAQIAQLFGTQRAGITKHLRNIFKSKELDPKSVRSILEHTASDGKVYKTQFYNLDAIISIGYRVNSQRATQFRIWATGVLRDHTIQGVTVNQRRIQELKGKQTQNSCSPLGRTEGVDFDFRSNEQRSAVLETLQTTDRVYAVRGCAGAGKTTCLQEIRKGLEAGGRRAYYLAPTASAVEVLRRDGFSQATTVHDFLAHQVKMSPDSIPQSLLIIDESSLQSTELGATILKVAQTHDARVLFVGDVRQHVSVEAGDFLRILEEHSKLRGSGLEDIRRQVNTDYNQAVRLMAAGEARLGNSSWNRLRSCTESHSRPHPPTNFVHRSFTYPRDRNRRLEWRSVDEFNLLESTARAQRPDWGGTS